MQNKDISYLSRILPEHTQHSRAELLYILKLWKPLQLCLEIVLKGTSIECLVDLLVSSFTHCVRLRKAQRMALRKGPGGPDDCDILQTRYTASRRSPNRCL